MSLESLVIGLTLLIIVGLWAGAPLLGRRRARLNPTDLTHKQAERLQVHYERLLTNLRDLEEDYATGKVQPEDYRAERERLVARGVQILMALDQHQAGLAPVVTTQTSGHAASAASADIDADIDQEIEAAIAAYRQRAGDKVKTP
ncbi:MAG: hypothetical protein IT323_17350 [Anaerolineae bacterium]|nr:hypothetical protein [Anaerolineae bacterium]